MNITDKIENRNTKNGAKRLESKETPNLIRRIFFDKIVLPLPEALVWLSLPLLLEIVATDISPDDDGGPSMSDRGGWWHNKEYRKYEVRG